jgi:GH18 family chitinase
VGSPSSIPSPTSTSPSSAESTPPVDADPLLADVDPVSAGAEPPPDGPPSDAPPADRRRWVLVAAVAGVLAVAGGAAVLLTADDAAAPPPQPDIPLDAWAPYWALDASLAELDQRAGSMRELSPFWFNATGVDTIEVDPNASAELTEQFLDTARSSDAQIVPSIMDALPAGGMAAILADPATRSAHVAALRSFAADGDYDGLDLDYEQFAFADGRDTWAATRPNWVAFIDELGAALHADGRTLTVSIPPVYDAERTDDSGYWVYDYGAIVDHVDHIRIMAYDYSVDEPGPIAPLAWVESAIEGTIEASGQPDKLVLGLPAYGRNWPVLTAGDCPEAEVQGRTTVSARSVDELIELRDATPEPVADTGEWVFEYDLEVTDGTTSCVQTRRVHYVDGDGIRQRMDLAREHGLGGVALWALGFDDAAVWEAILPTVADPSATDGTVSPEG